MKRIKRWLAGLLCAVLLIGLLPMAALADEAGGLTRAAAARKVADKFGWTATPFEDISECSDAQKEAITALFAAELVSGTDETHFAPEGTMTRWQAVLLIWRATGADTEAAAQSLFDDVSSITGNENADSMIAKAFNSLAAKNILTSDDATAGEGDQKLFSPTANAAAKDVETWLNRMNGKVTVSESTAEITRAEFAEKLVYALVPFTDIDSCSTQEKTAIKALNLLKIVVGTGTSAGYEFAPAYTPPRFETAILLWRATGADQTAEAQTLFDDVSNVFPDNENANAIFIKVMNSLVAQGILTEADATAGEEGQKLFKPNDDTTAENIDTWLGRIGGSGDEPGGEPAVEGLTRAEFAAMIYNKFQPDAIREEPNFTDIGTCTSEQQTAIKALYMADILDGTTETTFTPGGGVTRAAAAIIIHRATGGEKSDGIDAAVSALSSKGVLTGDDVSEDSLANSTDAATAETVSTWLGRVTEPEPEPEPEPDPVPVIPVTPPSSTSTETVTNEDGSTTTTVTNKTTGTVTETTENTDGSTLVVETKTDGTVTTTETTAEQVVIATVNEPGKDVTAAVTIPESVAAATVTIPAAVTTGIVAVNAETGEIIKLSVPTEDGLTIQLDGSVELVLIDNSKDFVDTADHWAEEAIDFVTAREIFNGTSAEEATFSPEEPMTRAMLMTVLARFDGVDTTGGEWYETGMAWAVENGVSDGTDPEAPITREQLATMLWRYSGSPAAAGDMERYPDAGSVSDYAQEAMRWAVETGLIGGMDDGTLNPQGSATRAQLATILMRYCGVLVK
ncbi:MAG: S-layer homology domain-containing protein [Oscillospiraceae bacterium]